MRCNFCIWLFIVVLLLEDSILWGELLLFLGHFWVVIVVLVCISKWCDACLTFLCLSCGLWSHTSRIYPFNMLAAGHWDINPISFRLSKFALIKSLSGYAQLFGCCLFPKVFLFISIGIKIHYFFRYGTSFLNTFFELINFVFTFIWDHWLVCIVMFMSLRSVPNLKVTMNNILFLCWEILLIIIFCDCIKMLLRCT